MDAGDTFVSPLKHVHKTDSGMEVCHEQTRPSKDPIKLTQVRMRTLSRPPLSQARVSSSGRCCGASINQTEHRIEK